MSRFRTQEQWIEECRKLGALRTHDSKHSGTATITPPPHLAIEKIIQSDRVLREAAMDLTDEVGSRYPIKMIDRVVGPQPTASRLAEFVADAIGRKRGRPCYWASPAEREKGGRKYMYFEAPRNPEKAPLQGERVLLVETLFEDGDKTYLTECAVSLFGAVSLPFIAAIANSSGFHKSHERTILSLINLEPKQARGDSS